ncbi:nitroreductase family protein [Candidatus Margulisiibacteriota bacterium]
MNFSELVKKRQSVRNYTNAAVEKEKIELCLEAARLAPSACNSQPWGFIVVDKPELRAEIARHSQGLLGRINSFVYEAPVIVVVIGEKQNFSAKIGQIIMRRPFNNFDIGISVEHFCLQAADLGLGTCIIGWLAERPIKKCLKIPRNKTVELLITLGYPKDPTIRQKVRKDMEEIRRYNYY